MKKDNKRQTKGFTLAELLIVVAIIAVLVAIGIPIFTSQLEKSREATDLSDVRSAYTEVMMAALTQDTSAVYTKDNSTIYRQNGDYQIVVQPLKQKQDDWQMQTPLNIGGVSSDAGNPYWIGVPAANGYCKITYHTEGDYVSFEWSGTGDSGADDSNPDGGKDDNNGNGNKDNTETGQKENIIGDLNTSIIPYPTYDFDGIRGNVYRYEGKLYVCMYGQKFNAGQTPTGNYQAQFIELKKDARILTENSKEDLGGNNMQLKNVKRGDLYTDGKNYYICHTDSDVQTAPPDNSWNWTKIN